MWKRDRKMEGNVGEEWKGGTWKREKNVEGNIH